MFCPLPFRVAYYLMPTSVAHKCFPVLMPLRTTYLLIIFPTNSIAYMHGGDSNILVYINVHTGIHFCHIAYVSISIFSDISPVMRARWYAINISQHSATTTSPTHCLSGRLNNSNTNTNTWRSVLSPGCQHMYSPSGWPCVSRLR